MVMESEQVTPVDSIKDVVRSSVEVSEFDKHLRRPEAISAETLWKDYLLIFNFLISPLLIIKDLIRNR